jgi:toxin CptA
MHNAPSVTYPVGRSLFAGVLQLCFILACVVVSAGWSASIQAPGWRIPLQWAGLALAGMLVASRWWRSPRGDLNWNGATWRWRSGPFETEGTVEVLLDLQRWMLMRCEFAAATQWLWIERSACPGRWGDLRRAVYSRARLETLPPRAAKP